VAAHPARPDERGVEPVERHVRGADEVDLVAARPGRKAAFRAFGVPDEPYSRVGGLDYMRAMMGDLRAVATDLVRSKERA